MAAQGQASEGSNCWKDPLRCLGFLPGACDRVNVHKKTFFETVVKKGLAYTFNKDYDFDPDSPILTNGQEDVGIQTEDNVKLAFGLMTSKLTVRTNASSNPFVSLLANAFLPGGAVANAGSSHKKTKCVEKTGNRKKVLVIGAGMSGLAAAYELKRAGHEVIILERQDRVGGRIKTLHFKPSGLRGEAGAMRIPMENRHYLTDAYIEKFHLKTKQFFNIDPEKNCFVSIRGETVRIHDFQSDEKEARNRAKEMCDKLWPGWDERIKGLRNEHDIYHIIDYYKLTVKEVIDSVPKWSGKEQDVDKYSQEWRDWMSRWSKMSFIDFLSDAACSESCGTRFRPWPKIAIDCITDVNYIAHPGLSVATMLAEEVGQWWTPEMKTLANGMEELPQAFINDDIAGENCLEKDVHYGITVRKVEWQNKQEGNKKGYVKVTGRQTQTKNEVNFEADAVIITVPLNAMRQVVFDPPLPQHVNDAIAGINYESSTKIFLGFRERFWEKTKFPVRNGGISKTDLPIGQIVYPSKPSPGEKSDRGLLLLYTWNKEALLFGSQSEDEAITEALRQVEMVYQGLFKDEKNASKVTDCFEVGAIQSWYTDPSAQGAFVHLLPYSYMNHLRYLLEPSIHPIYFGGEAISFANGWIQGALESGLRAAWQFYKFNEPCSPFQRPAIPYFFSI